MTVFQCLRLEVHLKGDHGISCFNSELVYEKYERPRPTKEDLEARVKEVDDFYYSKRGLPSTFPLSATKFTFDDALFLHFKFLRNHNVKIDSMLMGYFLLLHKKDFTRCLEDTGLTVEELIIYGTDAENAIDPRFLIACSPKSLILDGRPIWYSWRDEFYSVPVIRQLRKLKDHSSGATTLNEGDLPAMSATHLDIVTTNFGSSVEDIKTFLTQRIESKREFVFLNLELGLVGSPAAWKTMISKLDGRFVRVEELRGMEWTRLLRRNDGQELIFTLKEEKLIKITSQKV